MQYAPSLDTMEAQEGGGRLHSLMQSFESRVQLFSLYLYDRVCELSPLPFPWTVLLAVLVYITCRQVVLWYTLELKPKTKGYVYWHTSDLIDIEYRNSYKPANHLNSALIVYVTQKLWREKPLAAHELKSKTFTIHLLSLQSREVEEELEDWESDENLCFREHEELMVPVKLPIYPCWTPVHAGGVEICTWISTTRIRNCYPEAHRYVYLRVQKDETGHGGANADAALRRFVDDAVAFYFSSGYGDHTDRSLRMYRITPSRGQIAVSAAPMPLAPTLDTVFFPAKDTVRLQLQRFLEAKGRYAIKGFPRKLGYLLYGPRGTGKRSFVRALAYHTKRHIVRIPLSSLTKNEQLFKSFYFEDALTGSTPDWQMLSSKKVIFLLEDVDTESDLVRARSEEHSALVWRPRGLTAGGGVHNKLSASATPPAQPDSVPIKPSNESNSNSNSNDAVNEDDALTTTTSCGSCGKEVERVALGKREPRTVVLVEPHGWGQLYDGEDAKLDEINMSSLLNVLDGAIEDPERIVVMITDHPERLDPALLRPGRLSTHIRFDYIQLDELVGLCGLFYGAECKFVKGALNNDGSAAAPRVAESAACSYGSLSTGSGEETPRFPHEDAGLRATTECSWHRHEFESAEVAKLEEQVIRQLSSSQAAQVRACVEALEKENASHPKSLKREAAYNFFLTPSHAHHLCMHAATLDDFLSSLSAYVRGNAR